MFHRFILVVISFAIIAHGFGWVDGQNSTDSDTCTKPGIQCTSDCSKIIYCVGSSGDPIILDDCSSHEPPSICTPDENNNFICSENAQCSGDEDSYPVTCGGAGQFPAAYNCSLSYFCQKANEAPKYKCECPPETYFESGTCTGIVPGQPSCCDDLSRAHCNHVGEFGTFGTDCHPGYYYICGLNNGRLVANVLRCELGEIFVDGSCQATKDHSNKKDHFLPKIDPSCAPYEPPSPEE